MIDTLLAMKPIEDFIEIIINKFQEAPDLPAAGCFEQRAVNYRLLKAVSRYALTINPGPAYWTMARVSALLIGNHEILKDGNRWTAEISDPSTTLTHDTKTSLIDMLRLKHSSEQHPILGVTYSQVIGKRADFFLSFAYSDNFIELVDSLDVFFDGNPELSRDDIKFWFDMFVNNQWEATEHDFDWWATTFRTAVRNIGHTLLFLSPCLSPNLFTRAWCLFEISCSSKISVILSRKEQASLYAMMRNDTEQIMVMLSGINLRNCDCFLKSDLVRINEVVYSMPGGIDSFNMKIFDLLRNWIQVSAQALVADVTEGQETIDQLDDLVRTANLFSEQGKLEKAKLLYERALLGFENKGVREHPRTLDTLNNLGHLHASMGDFNGAKEYCYRALRGWENLSGPEHPSTLNAVHNFGELLRLMGDLNGAKAYFDRALLGYEKVFGRVHPYTLGTVLCLGNVLKAKGAYQHAKKFYDRALLGFESVYGGQHPETLNTVHNLGNLLKDMGDLRGAKDYYDRALQGFETVLGCEHPSTLHTVFSIGNLLVARGELQHAKEYYDRALEGHVKVLGREHPHTLDIVNNLEILHLQIQALTE